MKKIVSIFLILAMLAATMLAIIPASAANDTEVVTLLPDGVLNQLKADLQASQSNLADYAPYAPYVYTNSALNSKIADSKLLSITIPVYKTKAADNGNFYFTISVMPTNKVTSTVSSNEVTKYRLTVNGDNYGLTENSNAFKFIKVDLASQNI